LAGELRRAFGQQASTPGRVVGLPTASVYAAGKAAVRNFARSWIVQPQI
jgi:NAD(P)-dependent dehydrogenase (short-subunit alcohol dehydrogenase family)